MQTLWQDIRYSARVLLKRPGFALIAIAMLALGIGATSSVFSVVNAVLIKALPYKEPERLVLLWGTDPTGNRSQVSFTDLEDWRRQAKSFTEIVAYSGARNPILSGNDQPERVAAMQVSDGYFALMQTPPLLGRTLLSEDQQPGKDQVVILSYGLWQRRFGEDPNIIGQAISLDSRPYTVVGVMPPDFHSLPASLVRKSDLYLPLAAEYNDAQRSWTWMRGIARLKPNATLEQAQAELDVIARGQALEHPNTNSGRGVRVVKLQADLVRDLRAALLILQGAVLLVVLIACVNLANLLLVRLTAGRKEMAIRAALGAGRLRLIRQMFIESVLLSLVGGGCGLLLTVWGIKGLETIGAKVLPELSGIELDLRVFAFTAGLSLLTGMIFGLAPATQISVLNLGDSLKEGGRSSGAPSNRRGLRQLLVVCEIALSVVLLVCAGLLIRSFLNLRSVNPGFDPRQALTMNIALPEAKYPRGPKQVAFFHDLISRVQRLPGVDYAAVVSVLPESGNFDHTLVEVEGRSYRPGEQPTPDVYRVSPDYFHALAIPLLKGRCFSEQDDADHPRVALINETMARKLWPGADPIGKRMGRGPGNSTRTVIGVVGDVYQYGLDSEKTMQLYVPHAENAGGNMTLVVRSSIDPLRLLSAIRAEVRAMDKDQPVYEVATMEQMLADSMARQRFSMSLLAFFAAGALLLAAIGIYGVLSYAVTQRTHEFGIRLALGAKPRDVLKLVLRDGVVLVVIGMATGIAGAFAATRAMTSLLFGVVAADPLTFSGVAVVLSGVALFACYLPARKATKVDPLVALRYE
jgi:putative ABC transport system permease protein